MKKRAPWLHHGTIWGVAVGAGLVAWLNPGGGFDAFHFFFRPQLTTVPPWVNLFLKPVAALPWPYAYGVWVALTCLGVAYASWGVARNSGWPWVLFSLPAIWELWSGQIEALLVGGLVIAWAVAEGRLAPVWLGLGWLGLLSKPWLGAPAALLALYWVLRERGAAALVPALGLAAALVGGTFLFWPHWITQWLIPFVGANAGRFARLRPPPLIVRGEPPAWPLGPAWPWGLLAWPVVARMWPKVRHHRLGALRLVFAATLLSVPFLRFYHALPLLALVEDARLTAAAFGLGWGLVAVASLWGTAWGQWAWTIPLLVLLGEGVRLARRGEP